MPETLSINTPLTDETLQNLKTGDRVVVDGDQGVVRLLDIES